MAQHEDILIMPHPELIDGLSQQFHVDVAKQGSNHLADLYSPLLTGTPAEEKAEPLVKRIPELHPFLAA